MIGSMRDRVGFYKRTTSSDGYGNTRGDWSGSAEFTAAAAIKPKLGGEQVLAGRLEGRNLVNITIRNCEAASLITTDWRVKDERKGTLYSILSIIDPSVLPSHQGRFVELLCEKGTAA